MMKNQFLYDRNEYLEKENEQIKNDETKKEVYESNIKEIKKNKFEMRALAYIGSYVRDFYSLLDYCGFDFSMEELFEKSKVMKKLLEEGFGEDLVSNYKE